MSAPPSMAGVTLDRVGHLARTQPEALGRWGGFLSAAAQRGPVALHVAHFLLSGHDPAYASAIRLAMEAKREEE